MTNVKNLLRYFMSYYFLEIGSHEIPQKNIYRTNLHEKNSFL